MEATSPFVGLRPFEEADSHLFFGRQSQTAELLKRLTRTRMVAVVGSSGCGKSSLVRAGLIPALKAGFLVRSREAWRILVFKPGKTPIRNLAAAVSEGSEAIDDLAGEIRIAGADAIVERLRPRLRDGDRNLLLVVDQFEEIFRFCLREKDPAPRDEVADFVAALLALAEERALPIYVVLTMRSDFIRDCDAVDGLPEALNRSLFLVPRMTREQRRDAIVGPVRVGGGSISRRLVERLLNDDAREIDDLPVLQHALCRAWYEWQGDGDAEAEIGSEHYRRAGTVERALELDAEGALEGLSEPGLDRLRRLFQALTTIDAGNRKIRRPARLSDLERVAGEPRPSILELLGRFRTDGRSLLVWADADGDPLIDISHESLIANWPRLGRWVEQEAESAGVYRRLAEAASQYPDGQALWRDPKLQLTLDWRERQRPNRAWAQRVVPGADFERSMRFLDESHEAREREERELETKARRDRQLQQERRETRLRLAHIKRLLATAAAGLAVVAILALRAWALKEEAQANGLEAQELADYATLTVLADKYLRTYPQKSLLFASAALPIESRYVQNLKQIPEFTSAEELFLSALGRSGGRVVGRHEVPISALAISPDDRYLLSASFDGTVSRFDLVHGRARGESLRFQAPVTMRMAGAQVAIGARDGAIHLAPAGSLDASRLLPDTRSSGARLLDGSPAGWLVAGGRDGALRLWDLGRWDLRRAWPPEVRIPPGEADEAAPVTSACSSRDGRWLAAVAATGRLKLWRLVRDEAPRRVVLPAGSGSGPSDAAVSVVALGPDGRWLAAGRLDGSVWLWLLATDGSAGRPLNLRPASPDGPPIATLAFSPDGRRLVAGVGGARGVYLWRLESRGDRPPQAQVLNAFGADVVAARFGPKGERLVLWEETGAIRLWDVGRAAPIEIAKLLPGDTLARDAVFTSDGRWLFTANSYDGRIRQWDLWAPSPAEETVVHRGTGHGETLTALAFSEDLSWQVCGTDKGTIRRCELPARSCRESSRDVRRPLIATIKISPDQERVATIDESGRIQVWDATSPGQGEPALEWPRAGGAAATSMAFCHRQGCLLVGDEKGRVRRLDLDSDAPESDLWAFPRPGSVAAAVDKVVLSEDDRFLMAAGRDGLVQVWELGATASGARRLPLASPRGTGPCAAEAEPAARVRVPVGVSAAAFSADGRWLAIGESSGAVRAWAVTQRELRQPRCLERHEAAVTDLAITPDGRWLVTGSLDRTVGFHALGNGGASRVLGPPQRVPAPGSVRAIEVSRNGRWLFAGGAEGSGLLWRLSEEPGDRAARSRPILLAGDEGPIITGAFSPDGDRLLTASEDGTIRRWSLRREDQLDLAKAIGGEMTDKERPFFTRQ